jgi:drug/metabolite transporter (DMT)-like permease
MVSPYFYPGPGRASAGDLPIAAIFAGLGGALGSGIAYTLVRKLVATEHPAVIVLYFPMVCIPGTLLLGVNNFVWPTPQGWLVLLGVGMFTQLGQLSLTRAMQFDSASRTTSLSYLQIVFAAGLGWLFFSEIPRITTLMGAALILLGAFISAKRQPMRQAQQIKREG